jgi:hypothetical protein
MIEAKYITGTHVAREELELWRRDPKNGMISAELRARLAVADIVEGALNLATPEYDQLTPEPGETVDEVVQSVADTFAAHIGSKVIAYLIDETIPMRDHLPGNVAKARMAFMHGKEHGTNNKVATLIRKISRGSKRSIPKLIDTLVAKSSQEIGNSLKESVYTLGALTVVAAELKQEEPTSTVNNSSRLVTEFALINKKTDARLQKILSDDSGAKPPYKGIRYQASLFIVEDGRLKTHDLSKHFSGDPDYTESTPGCPVLKSGNLAPFRRSILDHFARLGLNELAKAETSSRGHVFAKAA